MSSKITIIGAGSVGSTIAYTLSNEDIASEIVLIDINKKKVEGEVMDIAQGTCFRDPVSIIAGEYEDAKDSDIVIITSGIARKPGQTRIELTQTNVNILKSITPEIVKAAPNAIYIIVSNPVDIMTYVFTKISGLPENQILGSGTMLDSARLRCGLSEHLNIAQKNIHAYVFGEHGDTSFIPWSGAYVSGVSLDEYYETVEKMGRNVTKIDKDAMLEYVRTSGGQVIANKGATFYAVSVAVCKLVATILSSSDSVATVSSMMHGEYGIEDVCLSTLTLVGPKGVQGKIPMRMTKEEVEKLLGSPKKDTFSILIAHNPEYFPYYAAWGADLTVSGHIHGGIMRLPWIGGVISPSLRLFPKYDSGEFEENGKKMILSRGMGLHHIKLRFFNRPEISVIKITCQDKSK